jgi:hypothetical protein
MRVDAVEIGTKVEIRLIVTESPRPPVVPKTPAETWKGVEKR